MPTPTEGIAALAAAFMMAASPVTGNCEARTVLLCSGEGQIHQMLIWDEEAPDPQPGVSKGCHSCVLDKRKVKTDRRRQRMA